MEDEIIVEGEFEYVERGEGPVIVLLHGLFGALSNFADVMNHFSTRYKVVIPLLPIYKLPVINTNVKSLAKYLADFLTHKNYTRVNLLGNSLGGHVALIYVSKYPENVQSMILTGSSGLYENAFGGTFPKRSDKNFVKTKVELTFYDPGHATQALVDECYDLVNEKSSLVRILSLAKSAIRHNMSKELANISTPTCLIWGKNDTITPPEVATEFCELMPNADLYWIDKCGHAAMMEQPVEFNKIVDKWLNKLFHV